MSDYSKKIAAFEKYFICISIFIFIPSARDKNVQEKPYEYSHKKISGPILN